MRELVERSYLHFFCISSQHEQSGSLFLVFESTEWLWASIVDDPAEGVVHPFLPLLSVTCSNMQYSVWTTTVSACTHACMHVCVHGVCTCNPATDHVRAQKRTRLPCTQRIDIYSELTMHRAHTGPCNQHIDIYSKLTMHRAHTGAWYMYKPRLSHNKFPWPTPSHTYTGQALCCLES